MSISSVFFSCTMYISSVYFTYTMYISSEFYTCTMYISSVFHTCTMNILFTYLTWDQYNLNCSTCHTVQKHRNIHTQLKLSTVHNQHYTLYCTVYKHLSILPICPTKHITDENTLHCILYKLLSTIV